MFIDPLYMYKLVKLEDKTTADRCFYMVRSVGNKRVLNFPKIRSFGVTYAYMS